MISPQLTQCPKCATSFRVTPSQLRAAAGSVRCGSCLEVFDALNHLVVEADKNENNTKSEKTAPTPKQERTVEPALSELQHTDNLPEPAPPESFHSLFDDLDKEHIDSAEKTESPRAWKVGGVVMILIACLSLAGQYAWFNKNQLAAHLSLRPTYDILCSLLDCQLPALKNLHAIKSVKLLVRSLPDRNGLIVDSVILNQAEFAQPWPQLELTFSNIDGQIVASRIFRPIRVSWWRTGRRSKNPCRQARSSQSRDHGPRPESCELSVKIFIIYMQYSEYSYSFYNIRIKHPI